MKRKKVSMMEIEGEYTELAESCWKFSCFTRSEHIQHTKITECDKFLVTIKNYKSQAIANSDEFAANSLFHIQCMINASRSSLLMWVKIKEGKFNDAWSDLVDAQEYVSIALKVLDNEGVRNTEDKLNCFEKTVFPGWALFNSPGFIETVGECSICGQSFIQCDHIENNVYMGALCRRVNRKIIEINHVSLVKQPRDKRCVITQISDDDGNMIDYFTWEKTGKKNTNEDGMKLEGITYSLKDLDVS